MKKRCRKTEAVARVIWGSLSIMPTWRMKFTPLLRYSRSVFGGRPSRMEGVRSSSASVKSHWVSASMGISLARAGGC